MNDEAIAALVLELDAERRRRAAAERTVAELHAAWEAAAAAINQHLTVLREALGQPKAA